MYNFSDSRIFCILLVFNHYFVIYIDVTHVEASNTAVYTDGIKNKTTRRILKANI